MGEGAREGTDHRHGPQQRPAGRGLLRPRSRRPRRRRRRARPPGARRAPGAGRAGRHRRRPADSRHEGWPRPARNHLDDHGGEVHDAESNNSKSLNSNGDGLYCSAMRPLRPTLHSRILMPQHTHPSVFSGFPRPERMGCKFKARQRTGPKSGRRRNNGPNNYPTAPISKGTEVPGFAAKNL